MRMIYVPHMSNMDKQYNVETINQPFLIFDQIQSVFINVSTCGTFTFPKWSVEIQQKNSIYDTPIQTRDTRSLFYV